MDYKTYHYKDDGLNDCGWGCSYRNIQTILSCYKHYYLPETRIPLVQDIVAFFNKDISCQNMTDLWIEPYHVWQYLSSIDTPIQGTNYIYLKDDKDVSKMLKTDITVYITNNTIINDFDELQAKIQVHFQKNKLPIIIDNGTYSYCLSRTQASSVTESDNNDSLVLIDPHTIDDNNVRPISIDFLKNNLWMIFFPSIT